MFAVFWTFERDFLMPVLQITGECENASAEGYMIKKVLNLIRLSKKFEGKLLNDEPEDELQMQVRIYISIIFPSKESMEKCAQVLLREIA